MKRVRRTKGTVEMRRTKMTVRRANNAVQAPLLIVTMTRRRSCCLDLHMDEDVKIGTALSLCELCILPELGPPVPQEQVYNCSGNEDVIRSRTAPDRQGECLCCSARGIKSETPSLVRVVLLDIKDSRIESGSLSLTGTFIATINS